MPGKSQNLSLNSNVQDPYVIGGPSIFEYKHWSTKRNYYKYREVLPPKETDNWEWSGTTITRHFEIDKLDEKLLQLRLELDVDPLTGGTGGTYLRFCDYLGYAMIDYVELRHASNIVQRLTGDQLWLRNVKYMTTEQRDAENVCVAGRLSTSQRDYAATTRQHIIVHLPFYFSDDVTKAITMHSLAQEPRVFVKFRPVSAVIQTDKSNTDAIKANVLNVQMSAVAAAIEAQERDDWTAMHQEKYGIVYKIDDYTQSNTPMSTTGLTSVQKIPLDMHRGATKVVNVMVRRSSGSDGNTSSYARYYEDFQEIPGFRISSVGGKDITPRVDNLYNRFAEWPEYNIGPAAPQILFHSSALTPSDHTNCDGSINYGSITKPQLEIYWDSTTPSPAEPYIVTVITEEHSMVQHSNGELINNITTN